MKNPEKKFPIYFRKFELPKEAGDNNYRVYRACKTRHYTLCRYFKTLKILNDLLRVDPLVLLVK